MNFRKETIILVDSLTSVANSNFESGWKNRDDAAELVTLTASEENITILERENTYTSFKRVVYLGDDSKIATRINDDGGITLSTDEVLCTVTNAECNKSTINGPSKEQNFTTKLYYKIKELNKLGLYLKKQENI